MLCLTYANWGVMSGIILGECNNYLLFLDSEVIIDQINDSTEAHIGEPMSSLGLLEGL